MDRKTAAALDNEIAQMSEAQKKQLTTIGNRILKGSGTEETKRKQREYMRRYKARIALATQRGLMDTINSGNAD